MKVVIAAAGKSQRFQVAGFVTPKFLLNVFNVTMLEQVLQMFDVEDEYLIVITDKIMSAHQKYFDYLCSTYKHITILGITEHDRGPVDTIHRPEVLDWIGVDSFIISYCDFFVKWDYRAFLNHIASTGVDGSIVSFTGIQPSTRGSTLFAYLKINQMRVLEVREKSSFTKNRSQEYASTGIYYFRSVVIFKEAVLRAEKYLNALAERYVSLVYNGLLELGGQVSHFPVSHFVCLGTPKDYDEFSFWRNFYNDLETFQAILPSVKNKLIPMAGLGSRFSRAGISVPKPLIPIRNKAMFIRAVESYPQAENTFVVVLQENTERVRRAFQSTNKSIRLCELTDRTTGPGETILKSLETISLNDDVLVMSCDYEQFCEPDIFEEAKDDIKTDVILFYTNFNRYRMSDPNAFAYCKTTEDGYVESIVEKRPLSSTPENDKLLIGSFWFRNSDLLELALTKAHFEDRLVNGELYVANSLNVLLEMGKKIRAIPVKYWITFGDSDEFLIYHWWEELFTYLKNRAL